MGFKPEDALANIQKTKLLWISQKANLGMHKQGPL
jgi:hypothetical protein